MLCRRASTIEVMRGNYSARMASLLQGFWLIPGAIAIGMALLAMGILAIDRNGVSLPLGLSYDRDASAAREILSTIAGSLITVAGVTFSLTLVTLQLVSSQFTPRALGNMLRDRITQVVIGVFLGTFVYSLLVLRSVRSEFDETARFVPDLAVTLAIGLAVIAVVLLLVFLHHMASSIQVSNISSAIARQTLSRVDAMYPDVWRSAVPDRGEQIDSSHPRSDPVIVRARRPGYVQAIDVGRIVEAVGVTPETRVIVHVTPGDFVTPNDAIVSAWGIEKQVDELSSEAHAAIRIDNERNIHQDPGYGIRQLADIAIRALSPGVNDPTTALNCIGYLQAIVERLTERQIAGGLQRDPDQQPEVFVRHRHFGQYVEDGFVEVGRFARSDARVVMALIKGLGGGYRVALGVGAEDRAGLLRTVAESIATSATEAASSEWDRRSIEQMLDASFAPS